MLRFTSQRTFAKANESLEKIPSDLAGQQAGCEKDSAARQKIADAEVWVLASPPLDAEELDRGDAPLEAERPKSCRRVRAKHRYPDLLGSRLDRCPQGVVGVAATAQ